VYKGATTGTGSFSIPTLPAGNYSLAVGHRGFRDYVQNGIKISVAETTRQNVTLQIGTTTETITVTSDASLLKTENAEQSTTITRNDLNELPIPFALQGAIRDPLAFAKLTPGVEASVVGNSIRVNGLPSSSFKIAVDGSRPEVACRERGWIIDGDLGQLDVVKARLRAADTLGH
jgi:hypothetical protein